MTDTDAASRLVSEGSMVQRLVGTALVWALVLLVLGAAALTTLFRQTVLNELDDRVSAAVEALIAHVDVTEGLELSLDQSLIDPRYSQTFSGRYWQVSALRPAPGLDPLRSASLADEALMLAPDDLERAALARGRPVLAAGKGPDGEPLRMIVRVILVDVAPAPLVFVAAEDRRPADRQVMRFAAVSAGLFLVFAVALGVGVYVQVRVGLAPVLRMGRAVSEVRDGVRDRVSGRYPVELIGLGGELNALLDHSDAVVERARTHVGNLAHALKTPLTVLSNEARSADGPLAELVNRQARTMTDQVEHHLRRARAAASARSIGARTDVTPVLDDLCRTLGKIYDRQGIRLTWEVEGAPVFRGERHDLEELVGNLLDNACKWAAGAVNAQARLQPDGRLFVCVEDDGPGVTEAQRRQVLERGVRLDEQAPGTGLGLAIVVDLARAYDGDLTLDAAQTGGLRACLDLPAVGATPS